VASRLVGRDGDSNRLIESARRLVQRLYKLGVLAKYGHGYASPGRSMTIRTTRLPEPVASTFAQMPSARRLLKPATTASNESSLECNLKRWLRLETPSDRGQRTTMSQKRKTQTARRREVVVPSPKAQPSNADLSPAALAEAQGGVRNLFSDLLNRVRQRNNYPNAPPASSSPPPEYNPPAYQATVPAAQQGGHGQPAAPRIGASSRLRTALNFIAPRPQLPPRR
jgi:hypothetical protein